MAIDSSPSHGQSPVRRLVAATAWRSAPVCWLLAPVCWLSAALMVLAVVAIPPVWGSEMPPLSSPPPAPTAPVPAESPPVAPPAERSLQLPTPPYRYAVLDLPDYAREVSERFDNTPPSNPTTDHGATLGRVLFYDRQLSINGTLSCASCHQQDRAFTDGSALSAGYQGQLGKRNSMSLVNLRFNRSGKFFWDERAATLEQQVLMPIEDPLEMGHSLPAVVSLLAADPLYRPLFQQAFGDAEVSAQRIAAALAQFLRSIVSLDSRYDQGRQAVDSALEPFPNFTPAENRGKQLFFGRARCALCHLDDGGSLADGRDQTVDGTAGPYEHDLIDYTFSPQRQTAFFQLSRATVNGLEMEPYAVPPVRRLVDQQAQLTPAHAFDADIGYGAVSGRERDIGRFKASSLRNIALTAPYMHDGRFETLEQVVEHYNWSIHPHRNLDARLGGLGNSGIALPQDQVDDLVAFLSTLTDPSLTTDPRFSDPFLAPPPADAEHRLGQPRQRP